MEEFEGIGVYDQNQNYSNLARLSSNDYITEVDSFKINREIDGSDFDLWIDARSTPEYFSSRFPVDGNPVPVSIRPISDSRKSLQGTMKLSIIGEDPDHIVEELMEETESLEEYRKALETAESIGPDGYNHRADTLMEANSTESKELVGEDIIVHTAGHFNVGPEKDIEELLSKYDGNLSHRRLGS